MRSCQGIARSVLAVFGLLAFSAVVAAEPLVISAPIPATDPSDSAAKPLPKPHSLGFGGIQPKAMLNSTSGSSWPAEVEPNGTSATATPLTLVNGAAVVQGNVFPNGDIDYYSFAGSAGDRVYAAVVASASASASNDSQLTLLGPDGTTVIEFDDDNGSSGSLSSSIAGATLAAAGTYYLRVNHFSATSQLRGYRLYLQLRNGTPTAEVEPNDTPATANALPAGGGWVSGARDPALATEQDWRAITLNAGDTVFLSLDLDPERDSVTWNGRLGFALFGDAGNQILVVDDAGAAETPNPTIPSEAMVFTVKDAGTYYVFVDSATAATGGPTATYHLNVTVLPRPARPGVCTVYTSADVPKVLGPANVRSTSTITIPGHPRVDHLAVGMTLNHALMADLDVQLVAPGGNTVGIFTDIGSAATGGQTQMDLVWDDDAAIPPAYTVLKGMRLAPELNYRLGWFQGIDAGGTWTLTLDDDTANASGGTLTDWSLEVCEPPPPQSCAAGFAPTVVFATNFESDASGFTHSGTGDQWALGTPATLATTTANPVAAITSCNSGVGCWKTNLTGTYNISTTQELLSPSINLAGLSPPIVVNWAHNYQMESASFDHYSVDFQQVGGATPERLFEWLGATMTNAAGNPIVNAGESTGWAQMSARADSLAGLNAELKFHVDTDTTLNFAGVAIDDISVTACLPSPPVLQGAVLRRVHGAAGTFDLPLSSLPTTPTTEPRSGPLHQLVFTFDKPVNALSAQFLEGTAAFGSVSYTGNSAVINLTGVANAQYVTVAVSGVGGVDGSSGGSGSVRVGFLEGDVNQTRVVSVADLGLVNAQLSQVVTAANYLKDVNASGTLTLADKGLTNAKLTTSLPPP
jgi:subtilisin-like proprotein convertase family protein